MPFTIDGTTGFNLPEDANLTVNDGNLTITSPAGSGGRYLTLDNTDTGGRQYAMISTNDSHGSLGGGDFAILDVDLGGNDANQTRFLINSSGNIGIGTAAPSTTASGYDGGTLHVHNTGTGSSIRLTNSTVGTGVSAGMLFSKWNDTHTYITNFDNSAKTVFTQSNSGGTLITTMTLDGDGNVGIGTISPTAELDVRSGAAGRPTFVHASGYGGLQLAGTGAGSGASLIFSNDFNNTVTPEFSIFHDGSNDNLVFIAGDPADVATQEKMRLSDNGLQIRSNSYNILNVQTDYDDNGTSDDGIIKITNSSSNTTKAEFRWDESEDAVQIAYGDHGRHIVIKSDGKVGIGTTNPATKLNVVNNSVNYAQIGTSYSGHYFESQSWDNYDGFEIYQQHGSNTTRNSFIVNDNRTGSKSAALLVRGDGHIGINTGDPDDILTINQGGASKYIRMEGPSSGDIAGGLQLFRGSTLRASFYANPTHNLTILSETGINFRSNGGERFRVDHAQANMVHVQGDTADHTGTGGGSKGFSLATAGGTSCPLYFGTETNAAQKSMYMNGYWIYIRGHQNEGVRFVFSQGGGTAIRSDQYQFKYNSATRPTGNTTWDGFSDSRAKENVQTLTNALDTIGQLRPVTFDWTDDYADRMNMFEMDTTDAQTYNHFSVKENGYDLDRKTAQIGFIAQEFETVFPKSITEQELELGDTTIQDFKTVNYDHLIPTLTKAIQELKAENDALRARLDAAGL